ncbi:MAG: hypothetical protein J5706_05875, partial [Elusimicrobiales bacterium]|nr:hypothetical protein [Elusimicrobiales bacterium]
MYTESNTRLEQIKANIAGILAGITEACAASGRNPSEISLMAVTKYASSDDIRLFLSTGFSKIVGENKVQ